MPSYFPFGEKLKKVEQKNRTPKKVFVLGVYASAVHARWLDKNGKQKVSALAVASEPEIFWKGENAEEIISSIKIPVELGILKVPKDPKLNGPSGKALDEKFLTPLGITRNEAWLCDLLPESRVNPAQRKALDKHYTKDLVQEYGLKPASIPDFDKKDLNSEKRRKEILEEIELSKAEILVLLGDLPIKWFLKFHAPRYSKLTDFGAEEQTYGKEHELKINEKFYKVIPLCHPRQAARLGTSSPKWGNFHEKWIKNKQIIISA